MSSSRLSITAADPGLALCSLAAFIAISGKGEEFCPEFSNLPKDDLVRLETIFKVADVSRSWVNGLSYVRLGVLLSHSGVTD